MPTEGCTRSEDDDGDDVLLNGGQSIMDTANANGRVHT